MDNKFDDLCESFGVIKQTKRIMYPRQIKLSEEFLDALKNEYYRLTIEEDSEKPVKNRPQKFVKALQFHVADLEHNKEAELEALRNMMEEGKYGYKKDDQGFDIEDYYTDKGKMVKRDHKQTKSHKRAKRQIKQDKFEIENELGPYKKKKKVEEDTKPYQTKVEGEKKEGYDKVNLKKEAQRRKEVEKENIASLQKENVENIENINLKSLEVDGMDRRDAPDYTDAYISYAEYNNGQPLSDIEIDELNELHPELANEVIHQLY